MGRELSGKHEEGLQALEWSSGLAGGLKIGAWKSGLKGDPPRAYSFFAADFPRLVAQYWTKVALVVRFADGEILICYSKKRGGPSGTQMDL